MNSLSRCEAQTPSLPPPPRPAAETGWHNGGASSEKASNGADRPGGRESKRDTAQNINIAPGSFGVFYRTKRELLNGKCSVLRMGAVKSAGVTSAMINQCLWDRSFSS